MQLRIEDLHETLCQDIPKQFFDLVEIAAYVYCADQALKRTGQDTDTFGGAWRRCATPQNGTSTSTSPFAAPICGTAATSRMPWSNCSNFSRRTTSRSIFIEPKARPRFNNTSVLLLKLTPGAASSEW